MGAKNKKSRAQKINNRAHKVLKNLSLNLLEFESEKK